MVNVKKINIFISPNHSYDRQISILSFDIENFYKNNYMVIPVPNVSSLNTIEINKKFFDDRIDGKRKQPLIILFRHIDIEKSKILSDSIKSYIIKNFDNNFGFLIIKLYIGTFNYEPFGFINNVYNNVMFITKMMHNFTYIENKKSFIYICNTTDEIENKDKNFNDKYIIYNKIKYILFNFPTNMNISKYDFDINHRQLLFIDKNYETNKKLIEFNNMNDP